MNVYLIFAAGVAVGAFAFIEKEVSIMEITIGQAIIAFIVTMSIPSALTGFLVWNFERKISKRDAAREQKEKEIRQAATEREQAREEMEMVLVEGINAAVALSEATARAVERIPDAHCNGDMHKALEYAAETKHRQKEFFAKQGIKALIS